MVNKQLSLLIIEMLRNNKQTLSIAESCTGGLLSYQFTKIIGASDVFIGSVISYQNNAKIKMLGIDSNLIDIYSPYSNEIVDRMLQGVIKLTDSTFAIATSGLASGDDFNNIKVGTVFIGLKEKNAESVIIKKEFNGSREEVQLAASNAAVELFYDIILTK